MNVNEEKVSQIKSLVTRTTYFYVVPLFLLFSIADYIFYKEFFLEFLVARLLTVFSAVALERVCIQVSDYNKIQILSSLTAHSCTISLLYMVFRIGDVSSSYVSSLNLVLVGMSLGFRFSRRVYFINSTLILLPLLLLNGLYLNKNGATQVMLNFMFTLAIFFILTVTHFFIESIHSREFESRVQLRDEIENRDKIIREKVKEGANFEALSRQFSPQVLQQMKLMQSGTDINALQEKKICVIFVDIVSSTKKINNLDSNDFNKCIENFINKTSSIFLKNQLTIDKFLGDGFLAFSNAPVEVESFVEKVFNSAVEILESIEEDREFYSFYWQDNFSVKIGIDKGSAKVGFLGNNQTFRTYSALGIPVNRSARLCSAAKNNEILLTESVYNDLNKNKFLNSVNFKKVFDLKLKGFNDVSAEYYSCSIKRNLNFKL